MVLQIVMIVSISSMQPFDRIPRVAARVNMVQRFRNEHGRYARFWETVRRHIFTSVTGCLRRAMAAAARAVDDAMD